MKSIGFVGYRGMVGSVLVERMIQENDFSKINTYFFSSSSAGSSAPDTINSHNTLLDAYSVDALTDMDIILSCQGGDYTNLMRPKLEESGWKGFWIDAASSLRMKDDSIIVLDPLNDHAIQNGFEKGIKNYIGGNCTVSLLLLSLGGLLKEDLVDWVSSMTYQAASGAGAKNMTELLKQYDFYSNKFNENISDSILEIERKLNSSVLKDSFPKSEFGHSLGFNLLPWIDSELENGQSKEEWKAQVEANKILGKSGSLKIDGTCVRVSSMRSHAQGLTIKLKKSVDLKTINELIEDHNKWVKLIPNHKEDSLKSLCPQAVSGTLDIPIGRVRKMTLGDDYLNAFTVGDQLLWGAAEPLRRTLIKLLNWL